MPETKRTEQYDGEPEAAQDGLAEVPTWRFRLAVLRHHRIVYRVALAMLRDGHEAEDVTQEAFLRFWQKGRDVRYEREWLVAVARNFCLDRLRKSRRLVAEGSAGEEEPSEERDPEWHARQGELSAQLRDLLAALPEPQRSLVLLFDVHGFDGAACARILGINVNQVKVYLHRARRRLRRQLEES